MIKNNEYAFQQEINARINLSFKTPLEGMSFFATSHALAEKYEQEHSNFTSWDDPVLIELVRNLAEENGYLID